jgi:predicted RNase H-like nuclease (RuvC/YqgF family)
MNNSADPTARTETRHSLASWVEDMQDVLRTVTALMEDNDRLQTVADSAQREQAELREELGRLRAEAQQQRGLAESAQREVEHLRSEVAALQAESERLKTEQVEAGESAAKLLGEMKDLVNQVAHKFQGPSKSSPFARDPRAPQS